MLLMALVVYKVDLFHSVRISKPPLRMLRFLSIVEFEEIDEKPPTKCCCQISETGINRIGNPRVRVLAKVRKCMMCIAPITDLRSR